MTTSAKATKDAEKITKQIDFLASPGVEGASDPGGSNPARGPGSRRGLVP